MRTLALLAALLLLALQVQAELLRETADQVPTQDLDQLVAEDQDQPGAKGQNMAISFGGDDRLARDASDLRRAVTCFCRRDWRCPAGQHHSGTCTLGSVKYSLCCY